MYLESRLRDICHGQGPSLWDGSFFWPLGPGASGGRAFAATIPHLIPEYVKATWLLDIWVLPPFIKRFPEVFIPQDNP